MRLQPAEIRLVVGENTGHQFNVRPVCVRQVAVPGAAEIGVSPGPLLFSGSDMVIRHMQKPRARLLVVIADEIKRGGGRHIGGRHLNVAIPGNVHARGIIVLVILARRNGKGGYCAPAMVHHGADVRREYRIAMVVYRNGGVGPPQEGLRERGWVIQTPADLDIGLAGIQRDLRQPLGSVHRVGLADIYAAAPVRVLRGAVIHAGKRGRAVVLRPVELNPA